MSVMEIHLPRDKYERLKQLADYRQVSLNQLFEEMSNTMLSQFDVETHFRTKVAIMLSQFDVEIGLRATAAMSSGESDLPLTESDTFDNNLLIKEESYNHS